MKQETARKAAKWWADKLRNGAKIDNGDTSDVGIFTMMAAYMLQEAESSNQSADAIDKFEDELTSVLERMQGNYISFGVDYHPDYILQDAADKVGLELGMTTLPWKTNMYITGDTVKVSYGYGAEAVEI